MTAKARTATGGEPVGKPRTRHRRTTLRAWHQRGDGEDATIMGDRAEELHRTFAPRSRRAVVTAIAAGLLAGSGLALGMPTSISATQNRPGVRRRNRRRHGNRGTETSINQPGQPGKPGEPGTVTGTPTETAT